jgi:dihydrofolate reductase
MRRLIVSMNITIDGFMAEPDGGLDWHLQNWNADMGQILSEQLSHADTVLLGRNTYSAMAGYWPAVTTGLCALSREDLVYAQIINNCQKIVCSTTLDTLHWNNSRLIKKNIRQEILKLKQQEGKSIIVYGSHKLVQQLMKFNLIDEYVLWVYPISIGRGIALFKDKQKLKLVKSQPLKSGVIILKYYSQP